MIVKAIKTNIVKPGDDIFEFLKNNLKKIEEKSIIVVTSKVVSYCENRFVKKKTGDLEEKQELAKKEADYWLDPNYSEFNFMLTIKDGVLAVNAGIDESNSINGDYILWPKNSQKSANEIWKYLRKEYGVNEVGVIITDSKTMPLRWGITGVSIACAGFKPLSNFIGKKDIFGRELSITKINVNEAVAVAAVVEMGESNQQQPLAIVEETRFAEFLDRELTEEEIADLAVPLKEDMYYPILKNVKWQKGGSGK